MAKEERIAAPALSAEERDFYVSEMDTLIEKFMSEDEDHVAGVTAGEVFKYLVKNDPELFIGWCWSCGQAILTDTISARDRSRRARTFRSLKATEFSKAAAEGDTDALRSIMDIRYEVDELHTRRRFGNMNKDDLTYAASRYDERATSNAFEAAFLRVVASRVGRRDVESVFSPEQIQTMRDTLNMPVINYPTGAAPQPKRRRRVS